MTDIIINEAVYVDPAAGHDKFYRTFVIGNIWLTQYGRNGTSGTFTKVVHATDEQTAVTAAAAKLLAKNKKGYRSSRSGTVTVSNATITDLQAHLDDLATRLPQGSAGGEVAAGTTAPAANVELNLEPAADITDELARRLNALHSVPDYTAPHATEPRIRPMLATGIDEAEFHALVADDDWIAQYKHDGDRLVVVIDDGAISVLNRQGEAKVRGITAALLAPFTALHRGRWIFDGERVDRVLVLFDLIDARSADHDAVWVDATTPFRRRYEVLAIALNAILDPSATIADHGVVHTIASNFVGASAKLRAYAQARTAQREGLILRDQRAPYDLGRRSTHLLKRKFTHTVDLVVSELATAKESATLTVSNALGDSIVVGSASMIGKGPVVVGEVWEVEFLYVIDPAHPRMVQPRLLRRRTDKAAHECTIDQFAVTGTNRSV